MRHAILVGLACALVAPAGALGADNPWLGRRVLHIAHQGGESESPSNTMFAYQRALANGADVLEMDVNITKDRQLVVFHDTSVDSRTNGTGRVNEMTLEQIKALDPADNWPEYRGIALGTKPPPDGYTRADFQIPTLREVLERYPDTLMNIEIKGPTPDSTEPQVWAQQVLAGNPTALDCAVEMGRLLNEFHRVGNAIVVSFSDIATERFKLVAPEINTATGLETTAAFYATTAGPLPGLPNPQHVAVEPPTFFAGIEVPTADFISGAHANGLAVHVWLNSDDEESATTYGRLVDNGVDGIMTDYPSRLEPFLAARHLRFDEP
ncbi:MAG: glycerophosphoryl diester phosphodiesterase [Thermoleophilaceae bacterium]|nr:glycerophosphoryl diester phosphodiesterase [Thermoleophilaceae bacterium]